MLSRTPPIAPVFQHPHTFFNIPQPREQSHLPARSTGMSHAETPSSSNPIKPAKATGRTCNGPLCSVEIMKGFCPTCVLVGVVILPFELIYRGMRNLFRTTPQP